MTTKHRDITDEAELHVPKGFTEATTNQGMIKNSSGDLEWVNVDQLGGAEGPPGTVQNIDVDDISDPKPELNFANLATYGKYLYTVQRINNVSNEITFYIYDSSNTEVENTPYILNTGDGGDTRWVAVGGKYSVIVPTASDGSRGISLAEQSKLAGIESGATADQSASEIETAYEGLANTNKYSDAEKTKLAGVEDNSTADQTPAEIKASYESNSNTNAFTDTEKTKLTGVEPNATADQSDLEIKVAYENNVNTNAFTDSEKTKLSSVASNADETNASNVDAAGAVMNTDSSTVAMSFVIDEDNMTSNSATKVPTQQSVKAYVDGAVVGTIYYKGGYDATGNFPDLDTSPSGITQGDMYTVTTAGLFFTKQVDIGDVLIAEITNPMILTDWTIVSKDLDATSIKASYESNADTNAFTDAEQTKLTGVESGAEVNQTDSEIKTQYEANANTNAFTDTEKTKLSGVEDNANNYAHPNHTGEVTSVGDGTQTLDKTAISNKPSVAPAEADTIILGDASDTDNLKKTTLGEVCPKSYTVGNETLQTITTSTYATITGLSITPSAGTYLALSSIQLRNTTSNGLTFATFFVAGVEQTQPERHMEGTDAIPIPLQGIFTVNGSQAIDVRGKKAGGGDGEFIEKSLILVKVLP